MKKATKSRYSTTAFAVTRYQVVTSMATDCNAFRRMMSIIPPKHFIHTSVKDLCTTT
jgi:hypothetical protein